MQSVSPRSSHCDRVITIDRRRLQTYRFDRLSRIAHHLVRASELSTVQIGVNMQRDIFYVTKILFCRPRDSQSDVISLSFKRMGDHRTFSIAKLSPHHLEVLALVAEHKSSKEIARQLGISPDTVDQRLKRVKALTGVSGRAEAARLYRQTMQCGESYPSDIYGKMVYQTSDLADIRQLGEETASLGNEVRVSDKGQTLHQPSAAYLAGFVGWEAKRPWYAGLLEAGRKNDLTPLARTICIGLIALFFLLSAAAAVVLGEVLSRLL